MKRTWLLIFTLAVFSELRAFDTLTIRQIYNFEVGDTFDYSLHTTVSGNNNGIPTSTFLNTFSYIRNIITGKTTSSDSITYVISSRTFNTGAVSVWQIDTILLTHPDSIPTDTQQIFSPTDSPFPFINIGYQHTCSLFDSVHSIVPVFRDSAYNEVAWGSQAPVWGNSILQKGLGMTYYYSTNNDGVDPIANNYYSLIYYSKGNTQVGTPYYNSALGINDIANISTKIYPNPSAGRLNLSLNNASEFSAQFTITDMEERQLYLSSITQAETTHDISSLTTGLYIWRIVSDNTMIKTGKVSKK